MSFVYYSTISYNTNVTLNNGKLNNDLFVGTIDLGWACGRIHLCSYKDKSSGYSFDDIGSAPDFC